MFERFTDRARRTVVLAQEEARALDHNYIGTEHLLLGLIAEREGLAARALNELGIEGEAVRDRIEAIIGRGNTPPSGHVPFTPRSKTVLELSLREALQVGDNHIGTEHLLLALVTEGEGIAAQVLTKMGADRDRLRDKLFQLIGTRPAPTGQDEPPPPAGYVRVSVAEVLQRLASVERRVAELESRLGPGDADGADASTGTS